MEESLRQILSGRLLASDYCRSQLFSRPVCQFVLVLDLVFDLDGNGARVVFTAPREMLRYVRNYHLTWPSGMDERFLLSFFPQTGQPPQGYEP